MFAPNIAQMHVVDHVKGAPSEEKRNVLVESARLARGNIQDLSKLSVADHDAIVFPGSVLSQQHGSLLSYHKYLILLFSYILNKFSIKTLKREVLKGGDHFKIL